MEAEASEMKTPARTGGRPLRAIASGLASIAVALMLLPCFCFQSKLLGTIALAGQSSLTNAGYVGSKVCAKCHPSIYESFLRTDMGRSMSEITPGLLESIPTSANIFDPKINRHFEIFARDGNLYQSEYETTGGGKDVFRETRKLEWIIGSGANGSGGIVKQDDYLFEAPLSFYAKPHSWALSPGYEFGDYGFNRPILPGCIVCHSGQPHPVLDGTAVFENRRLQNSPSVARTATVRAKRMWPQRRWDRRSARLQIPPSSRRGSQTISACPATKPAMRECCKRGRHTATSARVSNWTIR